MQVSKNNGLFNQNVSAIAILSLMYVFVGFFTRDTIINPFNPSQYLYQIELLIPVLAAIIFNGFIGGTVSAFGITMLELVLRMTGEIVAPPSPFFVIQALSLFIAFYALGRIAEEQKTNRTVVQFIKDAHTWYRLAINSIGSMLALSFIYPIALVVFSFALPVEFRPPAEYFFDVFSYQLFLSITVIPIILFLYEAVEIIRYRREGKLDQRYQDIDVTIEQEGAGKLVSTGFDKHALRVGQWTPIKIRFKHTWKAPRSYEIESISTSRIYPHIDTTPVLKHNDCWTQTVYVLPLKQEQVNIKIRLLPSHTKKFRQEIKNQTVVGLSAPTYVKRDLLFMSVLYISEIIIFLFLFSVLWNQIHFLFSKIFLDQQQNSPGLDIPWQALGIITLVELLFFVPFLGLMYLLNFSSNDGTQPQELAFSRDIRTHNYIEEKNQKTGFTQVFQIITYTISFASTTGIAVYLTFVLWNQIGTDTSTDVNLLFLFKLTGLLVLWILSITILRNFWEFTRSKTRVTDGKFVKMVTATGQFQTYKPNQLLLRVLNGTNLKGLRIVFKGTDSISPPMIELHLKPGEVASFNLGVTPMSKGENDILIITYPLFDRDGEYIPLADAKPIAHQNIEYRVLGHTIVGVTKGQLNRLKHIFGWSSLIASTVSFASQYVGVEQIFTQWQDAIPWLVTLQVPFIYLYYLFSNRFITHIQAY